MGKHKITQTIKDRYIVQIHLFNKSYWQFLQGDKKVSQQCICPVINNCKSSASNFINTQVKNNYNSIFPTRANHNHIKLFGL